MSRILPYSVIPIFLNRGTITGQIGAQLYSFDVFYKLPPAVGFHVLGCEEIAGVVGFNIAADIPMESVTGLSIISRPLDAVMGFNVESED